MSRRPVRLLRQAFGVTFAVTLEVRVAAARLRQAFPPGTTAAPRARPKRAYTVSRTDGGHRIEVDATVLVADVPLDAALAALEGDLALFVAAASPAHVFIHAGVVELDGRALVLPGRTLAGKSTLVAMLVRRGCRYYSDEYAVLDRRGRVHPYPRAMSLRRSRGAPRRVRPKRPGRQPLRVGWVYGLQFKSSAADLEVEALTPGRMALLLMDNAVAARLAPSRVVAALRAAVEGAAGFSGVRGESAKASARLLADCL